MPKKVVTVCFSGTGHNKYDAYIAGALYRKVKGVDLSSRQREPLLEAQHLKAGFNGCGIDYGVTGTLFGRGLDQQCRQIINHVKTLIQAGNEVTLNVYGHSRGAIAAMMLAKQLSKTDRQHLKINLALHDPVPGNFIWSTYADPLGLTLANKVEDLRDCQPLQQVLAIYPYEPLLSISAHHPLIGRYPDNTKVNTVVLPGCHANTQAVIRFNGLNGYYLALPIKFFKENGSEFTDAEEKANHLYNKTPTNLDAFIQRGYEQHRRADKATYRAVHSAAPVSIVSREQKSDYYNTHHAKLEGAETNGDTTYTAGIEPSWGPFSLYKSFALTLPWLACCIKWTLIGLAIAAILSASGGFSAIPFTAALVVKYGSLLTVTLSAPAVGAVMSILCEWMIGPLAHKIAYPQYRLEDPIVPRQLNQSGKSVRMAFSPRTDVTGAPKPSRLSPSPHRV